MSWKGVKGMREQRQNSENTLLFIRVELIICNSKHCVCLTRSTYNYLHSRPLTNVE